MTKKIKHVSELPDWFKLEKYEKAKNLTAIGWYQQIDARFFIEVSGNHHNFIYEEDNEIDDDYYANLFKIIRDRPIIDIATDERWNEFTGILSYKNLLSRDIATLSVRSLSLADYALIGNILPQSKLKTMSKWWRQSFREKEKIELPSYGNEYIYKLSHENGYADIYWDVLWIELASPDNLIIEDFKNYLKIRRQTISEFDDIEFYDKSSFDSWYQFGVLPYIDLFMWAREENIRIPVTAVTLWIAMTWFIDVIQIAPLAVITAPEKRCGKSQLLFLLSKLVYRPLAASNITPAALFRSIDLWHPTLLIDEADTFMRENEELRGLINCGHTRDSAKIIRTTGEEFIPKTFFVWGAKALAGIGKLSDTIMDRAIILGLRRKKAEETVERLRHAEPELFPTLSAKLARFAYDYSHIVRIAKPVLPESLNDRAQDNWESLFAIAEIAGDEWLNITRSAALKISGDMDQSQSISVELLADIEEIIETREADRMSTVDLINSLCKDQEKPWATYNRGQAITPRQIASRLKEFGIVSNTIRMGATTAKGYMFLQFADAFARYLSVSSSVTTSQSVL